MSEKYPELRSSVLSHPLYQSLSHPQAVQTFMTWHVFCVWDFQSLVKKMQHICSPPSFPWMPADGVVSCEARRLMNEIILEEESDEHPDGGHCSHFELYLDAMKDAGADLAPITQFLTLIKSGESPLGAARQMNLPSAVTQFLETTFSVIYEGGPHQICSSFTRGRETVIPEMFCQLIHSFEEEEKQGRWRLFLYYLQRHVEVDGETHGPASEKLLEEFCHSPQHQLQAQSAAADALCARRGMWDFILQEVQSQSLLSLS